MVSADMSPLLDLWDPKTWAKPVRHIVRKLFPKKVLTTLKSHPADNMFAGTMSYLERALDGHHFEDFESTRKQITNAVTSTFPTIRAFHFCKPIDVGSYLRDGIQPLSREWLARETFELFNGTIPLSEVLASSQNANLEHRESWIYFVTDPEDSFMHGAGHYLVYGPESMCCMWEANPKRYHESKERQRMRGIATEFECAVPLEFLNESWRNEVASKVVTLHFQSESSIPPTERGSHDFSIGISSRLPPQNILGHFHPKTIPDPLRGNLLYHNLSTTCAWCREASDK